jgi:hypothetical protein
MTLLHAGAVDHAQVNSIQTGLLARWEWPDKSGDYGSAMTGRIWRTSVAGGGA